MRVSVNIVTKNSLRYLFHCLESLQQQTFEDFSVVVVDNASTDGSVRFIRDHYPTVTIIENFKNTGFARAHNQAIQFNAAEYVLVLNPDVVLEPTFLERLVDFADNHADGGSFGGKMRRLNLYGLSAGDDDTLWEVEKTNTLDTTGLCMSRGRRAADRGAGTDDDGRYDAPQSVFGISGTAALYRRTALEAAAIGKDYFDSDFFAYKEDVDLAWRLRLFGWNSWYVPAAIGYHHRGFGTAAGTNGKAATWRAHWRRRAGVAKKLRALSFTNHHLMLLKNESVGNVVLGLPWILAREIALVFYAVCVDRIFFASVGDGIRRLPSTWRKRQYIAQHVTVTSSEIRRWFGIDHR